MRGIIFITNDFHAPEELRYPFNYYQIKKYKMQNLTKTFLRSKETRVPSRGITYNSN